MITEMKNLQTTPKPQHPRMRGKNRPTYPTSILTSHTKAKDTYHVYEDYSLPTTSWQ
uniref:Uncharacterized protein n=1 Tax=Rhizophora mucronata TaxID=61149 RepID=A0A2P2Q6K1_RHIMU